MLISFLVITLLQLSAIHCKGGGHCCKDGHCDLWCMYDNDQRQDYCTAIYEPGGPKIHLDPIEAPVAKLKETTMAQIANKLGFAVDVIGGGMEFIDFTEDVAKFAGKFASGLGIMGTIFSAAGSLMTPTPSDIINAVNEALGQLTDEINDQFANMQEYVDQSIREAQKKALQNLLSYFGTKFSNCIYEVVPDKFYDCIDESEREIHAASTYFMQFKSKMSQTSFPPEDIKQMETEFLSFMDYGLLRTVNLLNLYGTYNDLGTAEGNNQACRFLFALKAESKDFLDYTNFIYNSIHKGHENTEEFLLNEQRCGPFEDLNEGWQWTTTRCYVRYRLSKMLVESDKYRCKIKTQLRRDEDCPNNSPVTCKLFSRSSCPDCNDPLGAMRHNADILIKPIFHKYTNDMLASVENYWQPQTTGHTKFWNQIQDAVDPMLSKLQCENFDSASINRITEAQRERYDSLKITFVNSRKAIKEDL